MEYAQVIRIAKDIRERIDTADKQEKGIKQINELMKLLKELKTVHGSNMDAFCKGLLEELSHRIDVLLTSNQYHSDDIYERTEELVDEILKEGEKK